MTMFLSTLKKIKIYSITESETGSFYVKQYKTLGKINKNMRKIKKM